MANNLFIAYDLLSPGQNYDAVVKRIQELGLYWQFQLSLYSVHTQHSAADAYAIIRTALDVNDKLAVIIANDAVGAFVTNWDHPPIEAINAIWSQP